MGVQEIVDTFFSEGRTSIRNVEIAVTQNNLNARFRLRSVG